MIVSIHDDRGKLTPAAIQTALEHFRSTGITPPVCCRRPKWGLAFVFGEHTLTVDSSSSKSVIADRGIPTITAMCDSCGEIRSYAVSKVFPDWLEENKE